MSVETARCLGSILRPLEADNEFEQNKGYDLQWVEENHELLFPIQGGGS